VEEILTSSGSANSTTTAMVLLLRYIIIEELTRLAEVLSHAHTTIDTILLNLLFSFTK
jgi:hypothetical protein